MSSPRKKESLAETYARLKDTLADLQSQKTKLINAFPDVSPPVEMSEAKDSLQKQYNATNDRQTGQHASKDPEDRPHANSTSTTSSETTDAWQSRQFEQATLAKAQAVIQRHIKLLHTYNEIRDVGQGLFGLIAEQRGVRVIDVMEDFGMEAKD